MTNVARFIVPGAGRLMIEDHPAGWGVVSKNYGTPGRLANYVDLRTAGISMDPARAKICRALAAEMRHDVIFSVSQAGCGHPGGSLAKADMMSVLYANHLRFDHSDPKNPNRDRFVMSTGHCAPVLYSALALSGFFPSSDLARLRQADSHLSGHPNMWKTPGVDFSTGRLGLGFSASVGMALAAKMRKADYKVYTCIGDGESQEGIVTEAAELAPALGLNNLIAFMDSNGLSINGSVRNVSRVDQPLKWLSMGWQVIEVDGHDVPQLDLAFSIAREAQEMPTMIIGNCAKGKGVSFMENNPEWHGKAPKGDEVAKANSEIDAKRDADGVAAGQVILESKRLPQVQQEPFQQIGLDFAPWRKKQATRNTFGEWLVAAMRQNPRLTPGDADLNKSVMTAAAGKEFHYVNLDPNGRSWDPGIRESLMFGMGAGLAEGGFIPVMATFAKFVPVGADIIQQGFAMPHLPGIIIGTHAGLQVAEDGPTHMDLESLRMMGSIHGVDVFEPGDPESAAQILTWAHNSLRDDPRPIYIRLTRSDIPYVATSAPLEIFSGYRVLNEGNFPGEAWNVPSGGEKQKAAITMSLVASGAMMETAVKVASLINSNAAYKFRVAQIVDAFSPSRLGAFGDPGLFTGSQVVATMIDATPETLAEPVMQVLFRGKQTPLLMQFGADPLHAITGKINDVYRKAGLLPEQIVATLTGNLV